MISCEMGIFLLRFFLLNLYTYEHYMRMRMHMRVFVHQFRKRIDGNSPSFNQCNVGATMTISQNLGKTAQSRWTCFFFILYFSFILRFGFVRFIQCCVHMFHKIVHTFVWMLNLYAGFYLYGCEYCFVFKWTKR